MWIQRNTGRSLNATPRYPLRRLLRRTPWESLIAALSGTPYKKVISDVYGSNSRELFDYELALDVFFFDRFWKLIKKDLKEEDQEVIARSVGTYIDALNLTWVYRAKKILPYVSSRGLCADRPSFTTG